jgi:Tfp pilus assembly protein PilO
MDSIKKPNQVATEPKKKVEVPKTEISQAQDKSARNYIIIMCVVMGVIVVAGGYLIYRLATQFAYISNVNRAQDMLLSSLNTKQKNLDDLQPNLAKITAKDAGGISTADRILSAMPVTQAYENLIATLETMGQQSGVKVTSVSLSGDSATPDGAAPSGSGNAPVPVNFTVNVEGSYSAIIAFLQKTQQSARVINFDSMTVSGGSAGSLTASLTMTTYYQPEANIDSTYETLK